MGIRTGEEYRKSLNDGRRLFIDGDVIEDVASYDPFKGVINTIAQIYDSQHSEFYANATTYVSPTSGERVSTSYLPAQTLTEFQQRLRCDYIRTDLTCGMMGRLTDFMSAFLLDHEAGARAMGKIEVAEKYQWLIEHSRENDLQLTHTLIDPQSDRSVRGVPAEAVRLVEKRADGIVVSGARLLSTLAPVANECYVGAFLPRFEGEEEFTLTFSLPMNTPGLKIVARESFDKIRSLFDRPLSGRFDEGDAILLFDNVFVPEERVIIAGDIAAYNGCRPLSVGYTALQATARSNAKLRFLTGLCALVASATGRDKTSHYQQKVGELVALLNLSEGLMQAACSQGADIAAARARGEIYPSAQLGEPSTQSSFGGAAINIFYPYANTLAVECLKMLAGSGQLSITKEDYDNPELKPLLNRLMIGPGINAEDRIQLMKLVWEVTGTEFGSRQSLYERLYSGDPVKNKEVWYNAKKRTECENMVRRLLGWPSA